MGETADAAAFIAHWRGTGGSELANTQSFINGLCRLIGVEPPRGSRTDDAQNDYVFERRVFQDNGDGTVSFGRIDCYKRGAFILEAKQGSEADRAAAQAGEDDLDLFGQTATARLKRGTARRGTPGWAKAMVQAKGQAERYAKALPADHGWPPFLLIADIGYCIEVYADFSGTKRPTPSSCSEARPRPDSSLCPHCVASSLDACAPYELAACLGRHGNSGTCPAIGSQTATFWALGSRVVQSQNGMAVASATPERKLAASLTSRWPPCESP